MPNYKTSLSTPPNLARDFAKWLVAMISPLVRTGSATPGAVQRGELPRRRAEGNAEALSFSDACLLFAFQNMAVGQICT